MAYVTKVMYGQLRPMGYQLSQIQDSATVLDYGEGPLCSGGYYLKPHMFLFGTGFHEFV